MTSTKVSIPFLILAVFIFAGTQALGEEPSWTWMGGSDTCNEPGVYGVKGTPDPANFPGGRRYASYWWDGAGNLWLLGGEGRDSADDAGRLNDLWRLDTNGEWTWMNGSDIRRQWGAYGVKGLPDPDNVPGARGRSAAWIDDAGDMWIMGGYGRPSSGGENYLNDLWRYDTNGEWAWMSGSDTGGQDGVFGVKGIPDPANVPSARRYGAYWRDAAGNLWLMGGYGANPASGGNLNDLWRYDTNGEWTWMSGSDIDNQAGVYGVKGLPDPGNVPGGRSGGVSWIDGTGNLWLFGGAGLDIDGNDGAMNDLWRYDSDGEWTWMGGSDTVAQEGVYGVKGVPNPASVPGGRHHSLYWPDNSGGLWLMGGLGWDSHGTYGLLNDLWYFDANGEWTWVAGSDTCDEAGSYGVHGVPDPANVPGGRQGGVLWLDGSGYLWLMGGNGLDVDGITGRMNDLWRFGPLPLETHLLTVSKSGSGEGVVASDPAGIDCGFTCTASFEHGTVVTLEAEAAPDSVFLGWDGEGCSGVGTCVVTMTEARSVSAAFTLGVLPLQPDEMRLDPESGATSNGNLILEPGETVVFHPAWHNPGLLARTATGSLAPALGPGGTLIQVVDATADYGNIPGGETRDSREQTGDSYTLYLPIPAQRPSTHWHIEVTETLSTGQVHTWSIHVGDSFVDVGVDHWAYRFIETLLHSGITAGCSANEYCPAAFVNRWQMGVFLAKAMIGDEALLPDSGTVPGLGSYTCGAGGVSVFGDVPPTDPACRHIHYIAAEEVTAGCGGGNYCPAQQVTRWQMGVFLAKAMVGDEALLPDSGTVPGMGSYTCGAGGVSVFGDVPPTDPACRHIHYIAAEGVTAGCGGGNYCPTHNLSRDQMAVFLVKAFDLTLE